MKQTSMFKGLRKFLLLWGSQTVSCLGTEMTNFALIIWVYGQTGQASSVTLLTICAFLPTILFRFIAGTLADRWDKKRIMLLSDLLAACATVTVLVLFSCSALRAWHLYVINLILSFMNAFQSPAAYVATSLLVPKEQYTRVSGLQSIGGSMISILAPVLGGAVLGFGGLKLVLILDLASFAVAFLTLLCFIKLPPVPRMQEAERPSVLKDCLTGLSYLRDHGALLRIMLFFTAINFLAKMGMDGMLSPLVLGRTGNDQNVLGMVQSAGALGIMVGGLLMTVSKPAGRKTMVVFIGTAITSFGCVVESLTTIPVVWCIAQFCAYLSAAVLNANLTAVMRENVPIEMQGRVFSTRDTLMNCLIPVGLFLGGVLADQVMEPFMAAASPLQGALSRVFGSGTGSGIAVIFFVTGLISCLISLLQLRDARYRELDEASNQ